MKQAVRPGLAVLLLAALLITALLALTAASTAAQPPAANLRAFIERLDAKGAPFTVHFKAALPGGDTFLALPDAGGKKLAELGDDFLCYSEPWNNTRRTRCTPFSNILSLSYTS